MTSSFYGVAERLTSTTTVLGLFLQWGTPIEKVNLQPGDLLAICTDGVTEVANAQGEEFGATRLAEVVRENRSLPVHELVGVIQSTVEKFSGEHAS